MVKKKSALSLQEKRVPASALFTPPVNDKQRRELQRLADRPDSQIDFSERLKYSHWHPKLKFGASIGRSSSWSAFAWMPTSSTGFEGEARSIRRT
jgi:hypothetical protein